MIITGLSGHSNDVDRVALSRDNSYVVAGDGVGTIIIVHSTSTNVEYIYRADNVFAHGVKGLCFLPSDSGLVAIMAA